MPLSASARMARVEFGINLHPAGAVQHQYGRPRLRALRGVSRHRDRASVAVDRETLGGGA